MTTVKITTVGNSAGIVLPRHLLEKLRVSKGDVLMVNETPHGIELTAYDQQKASQMELAERIMRDNRNMLQRLAE